MAPPRPEQRQRRPYLGVWIASWVAMVGFQLAAALLGGTRALWVSPIALFLIVVVAASLCAVAAVVVLAVAHRHDLAELGLIGAFASTVSLLPLVHGLTTPGVLYAPNLATMSSVFWALPFASLAVIPLAVPGSGWARWATRRWRPLVTLHVMLTTAVAIGLLARPSLLPVPTMRSTVAVVAAAASLSVCFALSVRQLRLSWISRTRQPLYVALGFGLIGASSLVWVARAPFTAGFWLAHAFDIGGVFTLTIGAVVAYRQRPILREILRPLVVNTPLSAFELGLEPLVHQFVRALEAKDQITRDHVVRAAELAIHVGTQLRLPAPDVHTLGLGALLHDIGKLAVPTDILNKSERLTPGEYEIVKGHAAAGEAMARESSALVTIAPILRGHHERVDGGGYPDGLSGDAIPLLARVVSVCDGFDAMANTRQYREGMGADRALAILREHSGSQWDPIVVEAFASAMERWQPAFTTLEHVGRSAVASHADTDAWCTCLDALPAGLVVAGQGA